MKRILVAGIGNVFYGDDGFGCEVVRLLKEQPLPDEVTAIDYGIRGYDLAYALTDGYDAVILVDAAIRDGAPGTLYLIEPSVESFRPELQSTPDAHSLNPVSVIQMAQSMGNICKHIYLVGCQPVVWDSWNSGDVGLSEKVAEAAARAPEMIRSLVQNLLETDLQLLTTEASTGR